MSGLITAFKLTLSKAPFSLFYRTQDQKNKNTTCNGHAPNRKGFVTNTQKMSAQTPHMSIFCAPPARVDLALLEHPVILRQKRVILFLIFRIMASVFFPCGVMASAVKLVGNSIPLFRWRSHASRVTMTMPKHGALFWNITELTPHGLQGFHNDKNLLIAQSVSLHPPPPHKSTRLWL